MRIPVPIVFRESILDEHDQVGYNQTGIELEERVATHVTNQMRRIEGDFEKGVADSAEEALRVIIASARLWGERRHYGFYERSAPPALLDLVMSQRQMPMYLREPMPAVQ